MGTETQAVNETGGIVGEGNRDFLDAGGDEEALGILGKADIQPIIKDGKDTPKIIDPLVFLGRFNQRENESLFAISGRELLIGLMMGMRDLSKTGEVSLCEADVRKCIKPDKFVEIAMREEISPETREAMQSFLRRVGWKEGVNDRSKWGDFDRQYGYAQTHALDLLNTIMQVLSGQTEKPENGYETPSRKLSLLVEGRDYLKYRETFERLLFNEKLTAPQKDGKILSLAMACLEEKMNDISAESGTPFVKAESVTRDTILI